MPTPSFLAAQQVIPRVKTQCPRIVIPCRGATLPGATPSGKNTFAFFAGSPYAQTVQFRRMIAHADSFWESPGYNGIRHWNTRINVAWLVSTYNKILLDEIYSVMHIEAGIERHRLKGDLPDTVGRAMQIAKARIWGVPVGLRSETWFFHRLLAASCAKKTVPESIWKLACINTGNLYDVNENVLMDAILEQKAYSSLYAIHPLLGRSWVPWVRRFVEQTTGASAEFPRYAGQFQSALGAMGVRKSGMKTLHRMAETSPMTFRNAMNHLISCAQNGIACVELCAVLNMLNGQKPVGGRPAPGVTFKRIIEEVRNRHPEDIRIIEEVRNRHLEDILVMVQIDEWLKKDMRFDRGLVMDWMRFQIRERHGSLHKGYADVTRDIKSPAKRKEAVLLWANRAQQYWHRHRPAPAFFADGHHIQSQPLQWDPLQPRDGVRGANPILSNPLRLEMESQDHCRPQDPCRVQPCRPQDWTFVELTSSEALREEGGAMRHCVAGYDRDCHRGQSHIFSVRDAEGRRISTLELRSSLKSRKKPQRYVIAQNRGVENAPVSADCQKAAKRFLDAMNGFLKKHHSDEHKTRHHR